MVYSWLEEGIHFLKLVICVETIQKYWSIMEFHPDRPNQEIYSTRWLKLLLLRLTILTKPCKYYSVVFPALLMLQ